MRTMKDLLNLEGRVYVYTENEAIRDQFLVQAQEEGFSFEDGEKPTSRPFDQIYAINKNQTLNFLGFCGHMRFHNPTSSLEKIIRVNYAAYINFEEEFTF